MMEQIKLIFICTQQQVVLHYVITICIFIQVPPLPDLQTIALPVPDMLTAFNREQEEFIKTKGKS